MSKYNILNPKSDPLTKAERQVIDCLSDEVIEHTLLCETYDGIQRVIQQNQISPEPSHVLIAGDPGCGKTTTCDLIAEEFGTTVNDLQYGRQKNLGALMASVPSPVTIRSLARSLLIALGSPPPKSATASEVTEQLIFQIKQCKVEAVFLDESQHLYALASSRKGQIGKRLEEALNWTKTIINKTGVTFVLMGLPSIVDLFAMDRQLYRRFPNVFYLRPFDMPDSVDNELAAFVTGLLSAVVDNVKSINGFDGFGAELNDALRMHLATRGYPSEIKKLVIDAACSAVRKKRRKITMRDFADVYQARGRINKEISAVSNQSERIDKACNGMQDAKVINPFTLATEQVNSLSAQC